MNKNIKSIAFDLDGTIYAGNQLIEGAGETINYLKNNGYNIFFFTNNSAKNKIQITAKLEKMGFSVNPDNLYCCLEATPLFLNQKGFKNVYCSGSQELIEMLELNSINVFKEDDLSVRFDAVVIGMNFSFTYNSIANASLILQRNHDCKFVACNLDANYPVESGYRMPGCGPLVKSIEVASGRKVDFIIGKPDTFMVDLIIKDHGLNKELLYIVGDTEESDIAMAEKADIKSFLLGSHTERKNAVSINTLIELKNYL